jgi:ABC-type cobalt transport system substrate-binding protein
MQLIFTILGIIGGILIGFAFGTEYQIKKRKP